MERIEQLNRHPFRVCVINPYNRQQVEKEIDQILCDTTRAIIPEGLEVVSKPSVSDCIVAVDVRPIEITNLIKNDRKILLITSQKRSLQSLNNYIKECKQKAGENQKNLEIININPEYEGKLANKWWPLNVAVFGLSQKLINSY